MILWDVNVWVYAFRSDNPMHEQARRTVTSSLASGEPFLFYAFVSASFMRLVTNDRILREPSDPGEAWRFLDHLESSPGAQHANLDREAYAIFKHLCLTSSTTGNHVPDALLAAAALRYNTELVTAERGLGRFPGVRIRPVG